MMMTSMNGYAAACCWDRKMLQGIDAASRKQLEQVDEWWVVCMPLLAGGGWCSCRCWLVVGGVHAAAGW
jgi:hypothetical protein